MEPDNQPTPTDSHPPSYTIKQAAEVLNCHWGTVKGYVREGVFPGSWQDHGSRNTWMIPMNELHLAPNFKPTPISEPPTESVDEVEELRRNCQTLRARITTLEATNTLYEKLADERLNVLEDYRAMMKMLPAGAPFQPISSPGKFRRFRRDRSSAHH